MESAMRTRRFGGFSVVLLAALSAAGALAVGGDTIPDEALSAGALTIAKADADAFIEPAPGLEYRQRERFLRGRHHFNQRWVQFPSIGGDWGLGPTFITNKCVACHVGGGRGRPPGSPTEQPVSLLVRISVPGDGPHGAPKPHPHYGDQIQNAGLMGQDRDDTFLGDRVTPEAEVFVDWETREVALADGEIVPLRKPKLRVGKTWFGPLGDDTMTSLRLAPPVFGLGLLEAVPDETLLAIANAQEAQGFRGRVNVVRDDIGDRMAFAMILDQPIGANVAYPAATGYPLQGSTAKLSSSAITALLRYKFENNISVYGGLRYQTVKGVTTTTLVWLPLVIWWFER